MLSIKNGLNNFSAGVDRHSCDREGPGASDGRARWMRDYRSATAMLIRDRCAGAAITPFDIAEQDFRICWLTIRDIYEEIIL